MVVIGSLEFWASRFQADILSAVRAYVGGEALWSKAQKDGMQNLLQYATSGDQRYYEAFELKLVVPLGDKRARLALQQARPDIDTARRGFIDGGNHPDDVGLMIWLFRRFAWVPQMAEAIDIWRQGDAEIVGLRRLAARLHEQLEQGIPDSDKLQLLSELERSNRRLTGLEDRFSSTLADAARWVARVSSTVSLVFTGLLLGIGGLLTWLLVRDVRRGEQELAQSEARFRRLAEADIIGVGFWGLDGTVFDANDALLAMLRYGRQDVIEHKLNWRSFTPPDRQGLADNALAELAERGVCTPFETEWIRSDGSRVPVLVGAAMLEGDADRGVAYVEDLTARKRAEQQLRLSAKVIEQASEAILVTDAQNRVVHANQAFAEVTGYRLEEIIGQNPRFLKSGRHDAEFYRAMWRQLGDQGYWQGEIWDRRKTGEIYPKWLNISAIKNAHGEVSHYAAIFSDISAQQARADQLERIAHYDALTGLPNRVLLADRLRQAVASARRYRHRIVVFYVDLDGFKAVNDSHGHDAGDHLLVTVATRMQALLRESDTLARVGGDEFVGIMAQLTDEAECQQRFGDLLDAAAQPVAIGEARVQVSASIGATYYPQADEVPATQLLHQADKAMYRAKREGKNRYRLYLAEDKA